MKIKTGFWALLILGILCFSLVGGGRAASPSISLYADWVDIQQFPQTTLRISAWDAAGLPLHDLQPQQFTLQEDDGPAFHPDAIQVDTQAPVRVGLVIDISGSMTGKPLEDAKAAAARFLDRLTPQDEAALIAFSDPVDPDPARLDPQREAAFTSQPKPLYDRIEGLQAGGQTQLYNAAEKAARLFGELPAGHRAVLLLSDGRNEPANLGDPQKAIQLAKQLKVPFFVIGLGRDIDLPYLQGLASETGGYFLAVPSSAQLAESFNNMATLLKTQYSLQYTSRLPLDGKNHTLKITLTRDNEQVSAVIDTGLLPLEKATLTPSPIPPATNTPTSIPPTVTETTPPTIPPLPATPPPPPPAPCELPALQQRPFGCQPLNIGILLTLALFIVLIFGFSKARRPIAERCAKCGFDMTGRTGACPQCGETRRLPKG